ncbi:MAG: hypothetical protein JRI56_12410 [Deltaproteobacteria bacterium]|nr:hypothetical protein [Deltaproteobacteria bacterium]
MEPYFWAANILLVMLTMGRAVYLGLKLRFYMAERYPDKVEFMNCFFLSPFTVRRWLEEEDDTGDPKVARLKAGTKKAADIGWLVALLTILFWIPYVLLTRD